MARDFSSKRIRKFPEVALPPQVADTVFAFQTEVAPFDFNLSCRFATVEKPDGL